MLGTPRSRPPGRLSCGGPGSPPGGGLAVQGDRPTKSKWHWAFRRPWRHSCRHRVRRRQGCRRCRPEACSTLGARAGICLAAQRGRPQLSASVSGPCSTPGGVSLRLAAGCPAGLWPSRKPMPTGLSAAGRTAHPTRQSRGVFAAREQANLCYRRAARPQTKLSSIVNDSILERRRKLATSRNLRGAQRNGTSVAHACHSGLKVLTGRTETAYHREQPEVARPCFPGPSVITR